jgi:hypothetical protein
MCLKVFILHKPVPVSEPELAVLPIHRRYVTTVICNNFLYTARTLTATAQFLALFHLSKLLVLRYNYSDIIVEKE